jgi:polar amino acid transport system permease protein
MRRAAEGKAVCFAVLLVLAASAWAQPAHSDIDGAMAALVRWAPLIGEGFVLNVLISVIAMTVGTVLGLLLGLGQVARMRWLSRLSAALTQFFRNAPWLVLLFYCIYVLPFRITLVGTTLAIPNWVRATVGLTLPVMANVSEIVRGAVQSVPSGQWEGSASLALSRSQTLWLVILPQCLKRMLPPWMILYAILLMSTPLASIVGVEEALTMTRNALGAERRSELLIPFYGALLVAFFLACWPIALLTRRLEARAAV